MAKSRRPRREESSQPATRNSRTTVSGPAEAGSAEAAVDALAGKLVGTNELSVSLPFNPLKASEYEPQVLEGPEQGPSVTPRDPIVGASTVTERNGSDKVGSGGAIVGVNKTIASLDRVRVDSSKRALTTNQGVPVADNQHSLKAGLRGPDASRRLHPPREDYPLRSRADSRADRARARFGGARVLRVLRAAATVTRGRRSLRRPASRRPCSCASQPCSENAGRPTRREMSADSR